jgi:hypothetical protein
LLQAIDSARTQLEERESGHPFPDNMSHQDPIRVKLDSILGGRALGRPSADELSVRRKEAKRRVADLEPPGYCDAKKGSAADGDYLIWAEILEVAGARKATTAIFVTDDVKEDWWWTRDGTRKGARLGPRPELSREAAGIGVENLALLTTAEFLGLAAGINGWAEVPATVEKELERLRYAGRLPLESSDDDTPEPHTDDPLTEAILEEGEGA